MLPVFQPHRIPMAASKSTAAVPKCPALPKKKCESTIWPPPDCFTNILSISSYTAASQRSRKVPYFSDNAMKSQNNPHSMHQNQTCQFTRIARAIEYLYDHAPEQPDLAQVVAAPCTSAPNTCSVNFPHGRASAQKNAATHQHQPRQGRLKKQRKRRTAAD